MKQVFVLETFEDIEKAFSETRIDGDETPIVEEEAVLHIRNDSLMLESKKFVLGEAVRCMGDQFVLYCIQQVIGNKFKT